MVMVFFKFIVFQFLQTFKLNNSIEIRWTLGGSVNIKHFSDLALLDSIDISVRPITVGAKHKATKTFFQYIVCFIKR